MNQKAHLGIRRQQIVEGGLGHCSSRRRCSPSGTTCGDACLRRRSHGVDARRRQQRQAWKSLSHVVGKPGQTRCWTGDAHGRSPRNPAEKRTQRMHESRSGAFKSPCAPRIRCRKRPSRRSTASASSTAWLPSSAGDGVRRPRRRRTEQARQMAPRRRRRPAVARWALRWRALMSALADGGDSASITAGALAAFAGSVLIAHG